MSHACTLSNKAQVADVLYSCFGEGDFKVVVEEECEDGTKHTQFQVWSLLLRRWSEVFANMMSHEQFMEGSKAEVVIKDFSASAVEAFLRFLYSGTLSANLATLIEVGVIADKYQVQSLCASCLGAARDKLASETACEIFECADRFHLEERLLPLLPFFFQFCFRFVVPSTQAKLLRVQVVQIFVFLVDVTSEGSAPQGQGRDPHRTEGCPAPPLLAQRLGNRVNRVPVSRSWHAGATRVSSSSC